MNEDEKSLSNILNKKQELKEGEGKRDFAEATPPKKALRWTAETASKYLADVEAASTDALTRSALHCECKSLSEIVEDQSLPEEIRNRAATLRTMAQEATHNRLDRFLYADLSAEGVNRLQHRNNPDERPVEPVGGICDQATVISNAPASPRLS